MNRTAASAGAGLFLVTLFGFLGRFFWLFDLLSHFRVQIFQLTLVLIAVAIWNRSNRQLVLWVLLAFLNYALIFPFYFGNSPVAENKPLRAMLVNLNAQNQNTGRAVKVIREINPDVLVLEEVTPQWNDKLDTLDFPYKLKDVRKDCFGIVLLSKYPLSETNVVFVGRSGVPTLTATVHFAVGEVSVIGTHPVPPISQDFVKMRNDQLRSLPGLILKQKKPVLLMGDLNTSPWSGYFSDLLSQSGLKNSMQSFGIQSTWPVQNRLMRIPIDQVLHDPAILIHNRMIGPDIGSDHFPVIVDFSLKNR